MKKKLFAIVISFALVLSGCGNTATSPDTPASDTSSSTATQDPTGSANAPAVDPADMFSDRDMDAGYTDNKSVRIELNGTSAQCSSSSVAISGSTVTITEEGTYILSGTLENGTIIVNAGSKDKIQLVFSGVSVTGSTSAALCILEADKVFVTLADNTSNTLANGGSFEAVAGNNVDGAVFSKQDLTFNGSGSLEVSSPAGHGIVCKDDLVLAGGSITVTSAGHGLDVNDSVRIAQGELTIKAGKDGIHVENSDNAELGFVYMLGGSADIVSEGDGISAGIYARFDGGNVKILAGGGSTNGEKKSSDNWGNFGGGMPGGGGVRPGGDGRSSSGGTSSEESSTSIKGVKTGTDLIICAGTFEIDAADDGLHANGSLTISGGTMQITTGDDGIHAEDTLTISGGSIHVTESYEGLEAQHIYVTGGEIRLTASDDGLNAAGGTDGSGATGGRDGMFGGMGGGMHGNSNGSIEISGGTLYVKASGDGIDANGTLAISGGYTVVVGPTQGDTATLDYDVSGVITGGTFIGTGSSFMAQSFSDSTQGVIAVSVGSAAAGTEITLTDASGGVIVSYSPELDFAVVIISTPDMVKGETYSITVGSASGSFAAG